MAALRTHTTTQSKPMHLVINKPQFLTHARTLLLDRGRFAVGRVRRRNTTQAQELIIDRWQTSERIPSGLERAPMLDWAVMTGNFEGAMDLPKLIAAIQPKRSQLFVAIALQAHNRATFPVGIHCDGITTQPEEIRFVGSGMLCLSNSPPQTIASIDDVRSSRTRGALGELFDRVRAMTVALVGAGGGGQELARQLVSVGVRRLILIDGDEIGPENLDRMPSTAAQCVGQSKAVQPADVLHANQPELLVSCIPHSALHADAVRMLRVTRTDVIFSFVDNDIARLAVSGVALYFGHEAPPVFTNFGP